MDLFAMGRIEVSPAAAVTLAALHQDPSTYVARHRSGDWGDVDEHLRRRNEFGVRYGHGITSSFPLPGATLLVETALDHSFTRLLLASEVVESQDVSTALGYELWSATYAREKNPLIAVEEAQLPALEAGLAVERVLDIGTGTGRHALRWARRGAAVTAIDQSPHMLAVAADAARAEGLDIAFHQGAIETGLPVPSASFDLVICALMLCHIADLRQAIVESARAVRPGGHLLITDFHPAVTALGWKTAIIRPGIVYHLPTIRHTRDGYLDAVRASGCTVLQVVDALVRDAPEGYTEDEFICQCGDFPFCLLILAIMGSP